MKRICVIGSANVDLVTNTARFPEPGQTVPGNSFNVFMGGKGANQAVAAAVLGAKVAFLGKVGYDSFGEMVTSSLKEAGVDTSAVEKTGTATGTATIVINEKAENTIICTPGANGLVDVDYVKRHIAMLDEADILLLQIEIPLETVIWAGDYAVKRGKTVILDPAPSNAFNEQLLKICSIMTPNETEMKEITGVEISDFNRFKEVSRELGNGNAPVIINKRGCEGAYLCENGHYAYFPAYRVSAVDTTAAGDCFNGALAYSIARGEGLPEGIALASAAAALSVTRYGAQSSMPTVSEVAKFIEDNKESYFEKNCTLE